MHFIIKDKNIGSDKKIDSYDFDCILSQSIDNSQTTIYFNTIVDSFIIANPKHPEIIVAVYQKGRINNGGSLELEISRSKNFGKSWKNYVLPIKICDNGFVQRTSDPWMTYSSDGKKLFLNLLVYNVNPSYSEHLLTGTIILTSKNNGKTWSKRTYLEESKFSFNDPGNFPLPDQGSIVSDLLNPNLIYDVWNNYPNNSKSHSVCMFSKTNNNGEFWSIAQIIYDGTEDLKKSGLSNGIPNNNNIDSPIINPLSNGDLICLFSRRYAIPTATNDQYSHDSFPYQYTNLDIALIRSSDKGKNWTSNAIQVVQTSPNTIFTNGYIYDFSGNIIGGKGDLVRSPTQYFSYAINPKNGNIFVVYLDNSFRKDSIYQIGLVYSLDNGYNWSPPMKINKTIKHSANPQVITPSIAIDKNGNIVIMYVDFSETKNKNSQETLSNVKISIYKDLGNKIKFDKEVTLNNEPYILQNGPNTTYGLMTNGDYAKISSVGKYFYLIYAKSIENNNSKPNDTYTFENNLKLNTNRNTKPFVTILTLD